VQKRIKHALKKIAELAPDLAARLNATVRTGTYCEYRPSGFPV
jgi:hypothetical protein